MYVLVLLALFEQSVILVLFSEKLLVFTSSYLLLSLIVTILLP